MKYNICGTADKFEDYTYNSICTRRFQFLNFLCVRIYGMIMVIINYCSKLTFNPYLKYCISDLSYSRETYSINLIFATRRIMYRN